MNATSKFDDLYPDLARDGGGINALQNAQQLALRSISSHLEVKAVVFTVRVEKNLRFSQVSLAAEERLFLCDFWDRGVMLAKANTPDLFQVARSIHPWVQEKANTSQMRELFPFVIFEPIAESFEKDMEVDWKWASLESLVRKDKVLVALLPLVVAARNRKEVRQLFPFISWVRLCLSRCTGYPFSGDCPYAYADSTKDGHFIVVDASGTVVGRGDADSAVQLLIDHLPPNCGPAIKGTADNL